MEGKRPLQRLHLASNFQPVPRFLHPRNCQGTSEEVAEMGRNLQLNPTLLEKRRANGNTPIISASLSCHEPCVQFLLNNGAQVDSANRDGTALYHSVLRYRYTHNLSVIKLLLEHGANANWCDDDHNYILSVCVSENYTEIAELLLRHGANPNVSIGKNQCINGSFVPMLEFTMLRSKNHDRVQMAKLLLYYGASIRYYFDLFKCSALIDSQIFKNVFMFNGHVVNGINSMVEDQNWAKIICDFTHVCYTWDNSVHCLKILHKFGVNLWRHAGDFSVVDANNVDFYLLLQSLRSTPLSLKCLSRNVILSTMGSNYVRKYQELEVPRELHTFLEYPDI